MANIIIGGKVHCPLCGKEFKECRTISATIYACFDCCVSINQLDPALGKWDMLPIEECPVCKEPMKVFYRAFDRYMQHKCPKCGVCIAVGQDKFLPKDPVAGEASEGTNV